MERIIRARTEHGVDADQILNRRNLRRYDDLVTAKTKLTFTAAAKGAEIVLSLRTACTIDHGCGLGLDTITYSRTVDAGSYNLVVATDKPVKYQLTATFEAP